jgi:CTP synthase (UTP-ammonia lyase)
MRKVSIGEACCMTNGEPVRVGLIGDYSDAVTAHRAIPPALRIAEAALGCAVNEVWLPTEELAQGTAGDLDRFDGLWCVPASPYRSFDGVIRAIRYAREHGVPFLGTCGGFQHAVIEYARHALGHVDADHQEITPEAAVPLFARLSCSMVEVDARIHFTPGSQIADIYGSDSVTERYRCNFGMNPVYARWFERAALKISGVDDDGFPRAVELHGHRFFIGTAYQPERSALAGRPHPVIVAFVGALLNGQHA